MINQKNYYTYVFIFLFACSSAGYTRPTRHLKH
jgi:hypothetical protein